MRLRPVLASLATTVLAATGLAVSAAPAPAPASAATPSPGVLACQDGSGSAGAQARVEKGASVQEPDVHGPGSAKSDAKKYGVIKDSPYLGDGGVTVDTVFHVVSEDQITPAERSRMEGMIEDQMQVLNDAYAGNTAPKAAATPFRFDLTETTWTVNEEWAHPQPGKTERDMKKALRQGDSETLNVYAADIGGGLLGWAYFPKAYNNGRDYFDGVVILDESMPGGTAGRYNQGDTLTHEVGHWLMLEHTFAGACSASGDGVADTPREAVPQFTCNEGADTCPTPGLDPVHNFMDYGFDSCMNMFTPGQSQRMSDAWVAFRKGGNG